MKKNRQAKWGIALLIAVGVIMGANQMVMAADTIKIGSIWGLTGPGSQLGLTMKEGVELAAEWINGNGGVTINGKAYKIQLLIEDNQNSAAGSASAATKLVFREKVKFITGMNVPFQIEAVQTVTEKNKVLLCAAKISAFKPTDQYTFSGTPGFTAPLPNLYKFLLKKYPNVKTVAFSAHDEPGALATLGIAQNIAKSMGLNTYKPVLTQFGSKEYYPIWPKLQKNKPDVVDIGISFPDSIAANARHGRELGFTGPILTCNTGDSQVFVKLIGKDWANDFIFAGFNLNDPNNPPMVKEVVKLWNEKYHKPFVTDSLDAWSCLWTLVQAIEKAQSLDPAEVAKTWENMETIDTPYGKGTMGGRKTFGVNHMVMAPSPVSRLVNGSIDVTEWHKTMIP